MTTATPMRIIPASVDELIEVVLDAGAGRRSAAIIGAGSESAAVPAPTTDLVVAMSRFDGIVDHEPDDLTVTVRAGTTLGDLAASLAEHGQTAILPDGSPDRTVGGVVAAGVSGYRRFRYGPTRDRVIGVQMVTGYGVAVRGGGRLVKNVTGYDLSRLATGSRGALGAITEVTLKLWPEPRAAATVRVDDIASVAGAVYRPTAALETSAGSFIHVEGSERSVEVAAAALGPDVEPGHRWPAPPAEPFVLSVRVPPRTTTIAVASLRRWGASSWVAQHGVGVMDAGFGSLDAETLAEFRSEVRTLGGVIVVDRWPDDVPLTDRLGYRVESAGIEDRLRGLFDPHAVLTAASRWELD